MATPKPALIILPRILPQLPSRSGPILEPAANFDAVELDQPTWSGQDARRLQLDGVRLSLADLTSARLRDGGWVDVEVQTGQCAGLDLTGSNLRRVAWRGSRLDGLVVAETEGRDLCFVNSKLDLMNLRFAKWNRVEFRDCSLREADFASATLANARFLNCDLTGADFSGAKLAHVDLRSSRLAELKGLAGLAGATIGPDQLMSLAPELAVALEIMVQ